MCKHYKNIFGLFVLILFIGSCTAKKKVIDDEFAIDLSDAQMTEEELTLDDSLFDLEGDFSGEELAYDDAVADDEFADFDLDTAGGSGDIEQELNAMTEDDSGFGGFADDEFAFDEFDDLDSTSDVAVNNMDGADAVSSLDDDLMEVDQFADMEISSEDPDAIDLAEDFSEEFAEEVPAPVEVAEAPAMDFVDEAPVVEFAETPSDMMTGTTDAAAVAKISNVEFKGNNSGGAFVITADRPLEYSTRINSHNRQIVVEIENATVDSKFTRALITKDMSSSIDHVNIYQKPGSKTARFVIQLREGAPEPLIQPEGGSLLVVGSLMGTVPTGTLAQNSLSNQGTQYGALPSDPSSGFASNNFGANANMTGDFGSHNQIAVNSIMTSDDLETFLSNNTQYYGKKISIETAGMDIQRILNFIAEEGGINMVFDEDVKGSTSVKLRKVPWDQAFVILLKSKKLGYKRQGNVIRVALKDTLLKEDTDAIQLRQAKQTVEPLVVKNFSINYADVKDLETKVKEYISAGTGTVRGRVTGDGRTNTLIVSETASKLKEVEQLIAALDTQPQQVMIESRIVEALDEYSRNIGARLGFNRSPTAVPFNVGSVMGSKPLNLTTSMGSNTSGGAPRAFVGSMLIGRLGAFGNLDAELNLREQENKVKVLSSPRVSVLTNMTASIKQGGTIMQENVTRNEDGSTTTSYVSIPVGVTLNVTPQVSNIGTVRLAMDIDRTFPSPGQANGATENRNVKTEVIVKNGETAVIGGVFTSDIISNTTGVPGLKDLPILGMFFRDRETKNNKSEMMVFITPKIIPLLTPVLKADSSNGVNESF